MHVHTNMIKSTKASANSTNQLQTNLCPSHARVMRGATFCWLLALNGWSPAWLRLGHVMSVVFTNAFIILIILFHCYKTSNYSIVLFTIWISWSIRQIQRNTGTGQKIELYWSDLRTIFVFLPAIRAWYYQSFISLFFAIHE